MTKSKQNLAEAQEFIRSTLAKNFKQKVDVKSLRAAAEKIVEAIPNATPTTTKRAA